MSTTPRVDTVNGYHDWLAEGFADPAIWRQHQQQLHDIIQHCQDGGVTLRVALLPFIRTTGDNFKPQRIHAMLKRFFEANQVPAVDLLPIITDLDPSDLMVNDHDAHPNEHANRLFAEAIWQTFYAHPGQ